MGASVGVAGVAHAVNIMLAAMSRAKIENQRVCFIYPPKNLFRLYVPGISSFLRAIFIDFFGFAPPLHSINYDSIFSRPTIIRSFVRLCIIISLIQL